MNNKFLVYLLFFLGCITNIFSQEYAEKPFSPRVSYGLFCDININLHSSDFRALDGILSCSPAYKSGTGIGFNGGLFYSFPIDDTWDLSFRGIFSNLNAKLTVDENKTVSDINGNGVSGVIEHSIDAKLSSVGVEPLAIYKLSDQISINAGFRVAYIMQKTFAQKEEITNPSFGYFPDTKSRVRFQYSGDIPNAATLDAAFVIGASYDMPLNSSYTCFLVPQVSYSYGLTKVATDLSWNVNTFSVGAALKFAPRKILPPKAPPLPPPMAPAPAPPEIPKLDASIAAVSVDDNGKESNVSTLIVEENLSTRWQPVLNYIFFDANSANIPERYTLMNNTQKKEFEATDKFLYNFSTMEVYYFLLDIIGKRMSRYPQANLNLTGCNSNEGAEKGNMELSRKRGETIKKYLVTRWSIDESRLKVDARNLPNIPSNITDPDGIAENRRVEIAANIPEIFAPLQIEDTVRKTNPPLLRFRPKVNSKIGIKSWKLLTYQGKQMLKVFDGTAAIPDHLDLNLKDEPNYIPRSTTPFLYKLEIVDNDNKVWDSKVQEMTVDQETFEKKIIEMKDDKEVLNYSLISFEFNKSSLTKDHLQIINMAKKRIEKNSVVTIEGHTDRIGNEELNLDLSQKRALSTARGLNVDVNNAKGVGELNPLYNNNLPEGRFYNRTVKIRIETPISYEGL